MKLECGNKSEIINEIVEIFYQNIFEHNFQLSDDI